MTRFQQGVAVLVVALFGAGGLIGLQTAENLEGPVPEGAGGACPDCLPDRSAAEAALARPQEVRFEENRGQAPPSVLFIAHAEGAEVWLKEDRMELHGEELVAIVFPDAAPAVSTRQPLNTRTHYYVGSGPADWVQDVPSHREVVYQDLWPGVDMVVYGTEEGRLEFDHIVAPGVDPDIVRFRVEGATPRVEDDALFAGAFRLAPPIIYQEAAGSRSPVAGGFSLVDGVVGYDIGEHDGSRPLVIDPVVHYSSYMGENGKDEIVAMDWAPHPDPAKRVLYVTGTSEGIAFPGFSNPTTYGSPSGTWIFVVAFHYDLDTKAMTPEWIIFMGGSEEDFVYDLATDPTGGVALVGGTNSPDFPTMNAPQLGGQEPYDGSVHHGDLDGFATRLDGTGALTFSTYLGSRDVEDLRGVAVDATGRIAVAGRAWGSFSSGADEPLRYPLVNEYQSARSGHGATVVSFINPSTSTFVFSTYLTGGYSSYAHAVALDTTGIYVGGFQMYGGVGFPTTPGAFQEAMPESTRPVAYLTKFPLGGGTDLVYSTLLGGLVDDNIHDIAVDGQGNAWVVGETESEEFPVCGGFSSYVPNACSGSVFLTSHPGRTSGFVTQFNPTGTGVLFSSFLGGNNLDVAYDVELDAVTGEVVVAMRTSSSNMPIHPTNNLYPTRAGGFEGYLHRFDPAAILAGPAGGTGFTTYLGTQGADWLEAITVDDRGNLYAGPYVSSGYVVTPQAVQPMKNSGSFWDGAITVLGQVAPDAVLRATSGSLQETSDDPQILPGIQDIVIPPGSAVQFDAALSSPGDLPMDESRFEWTLYDGDGTTVLSTDLGATPAWNGMIPIGPGYVCVRVWNEGPWPGPPSPSRDLRSYGDFHDDACIHVELLNEPPVADFAFADPVPKRVPITFQDLSTDPDGAVKKWSWDFGDGGQSTEPDPVHTFAATGTYDVELTVLDDREGVGQTIKKITVVGGPIAEFSYTGSLLMMEPVHFQDLSVPSAGPLETWTWDFGDGSDPVENQGVLSPLSHTYEEAGEYQVTLTVFDGSLSDIRERTLIIKEAEPLPLPDAYTATLGRDLEVSVNKGLLANDGHTGGWALAVDAYTQPDHGSVMVDADGTFRYTPPKEFVGKDLFTYNVTDGPALRGPIDVAVDVVSGLPPTADFRSTISGDTVVLEDRSRRGDLPIVTWRWTFSDGSESTLQNPSHVLAPGHHSATLQVTDAAGGSSKVTKAIHIAASGDKPCCPVEAPVPPVQESPQAEPRDSPSAGVRNLPPTALAVGPAEVRPGNEVRIDGGRSSDPDGDFLTFQWRQVEGPPIVFRGADASEAAFAAPSRSGVLVLELEVSDGQAMDTAEVTVVLGADPPEFHIEVLEDGTHWFNSTVDGAWSLGDGSTASGDSVSHRFAEAGLYEVRLEAEGGESVQKIRVESAQRPELPDVEPAVEAEPAQVASVPEPRLPTAVTATAAGVGLLVLLLWAYRTWALVWIRVFTRVGRPELLEHPLRSQIHDAVVDRPGILLTDMVPLLGKSRRTVAHHVGMLEGAGMLAVKRDGGYISLHPAGDEGGAPREAVLRSPVAQRLLQAAGTAPGATVGNLAKRLGVTPATLSYHAGRLESAGLLTRVKQGRTTRVYAAKGPTAASD